MDARSKNRDALSMTSPPRCLLRAVALTAGLLAGCSTPPPNLIVDRCNAMDDDQDGRVDEGSPAELGCDGRPCVAGRCQIDAGASDAARPDGSGPDAGFDAGRPSDAGGPTFCPTVDTPAPSELMGSCCWRFSNESQRSAPELRLAFVDIQEPEGNLASATLRRVLNEAIQNESLTWLIRVENAESDGAVDVTTGVGRRETDGRYAFSRGTGGDSPSWCPVALDATLAGESITSTPLVGEITVPMFDEARTMLQLELTLRQLAIESATFTELRNCIGEKTLGAYVYDPAGILTGYIEVASSRTRVVDIPPIDSTLCAVIAGSLTSATYCDDVPQSDWTSPPNARCDSGGCMTNTLGLTDVCEPDTTCNAWRFVAEFAASGVDISNGACP